VSVPNLHTKACLDSFGHRYVEYTVWLLRWPHYCPRCDGWGQTGTSGGWEEPPRAYPCDCTLTGRCPRCGCAGLTPEDGDGPCVLCGWNYDDGLPILEPCDCWDGALEAWEPELPGEAEERLS
jgi:hypothetical protein